MYGNGVLIGNWNEENLKHEYETQVFLRKRERSELLLQKSRKLFSNLLRERPPKISGVTIKFGYQAQIVASDLPAKNKAGKDVYGLALSGLVTERQVDYFQNLSDQCSVTLSPIMTPCCRNTFTIVSYDPKDNKEGESLKFGEDFLLQIADYSETPGPPLYVRYMQQAMPVDKDVLPLKLSATRDSNCRWRAYPLLAKNRTFLQGEPVPQGAKVLITNCVADLNLCVIYQMWFLTFFGAECGVTLKNCMDSHRKPTAENIFIFKSDVDKLNA